MDPVAFYAFGQPIYWYGILISAGVLSGIFLAMRNAKVFDVDPERIVDLALLAIPMAIVGARLYYVVFEWDQYKGNLLDIFNVRKGGLAIYGGVLAGILAGFIFSRWKKIEFWNLADICAPSLILGQAIGRWGNYINQEAYGYVVNNPEWQWFPAAVFIDASQKWHLATFFYESFWNFTVFFIMMSYRKHRKRTGEVFLLYIILYSLGRAFIEGLRMDSLYWGSIRVSQLLSVMLIIVGAALFIYRRKHAATPLQTNNKPIENTDTLESNKEEAKSEAAITEGQESMVEETATEEASKSGETEIEKNIEMEKDNNPVNPE
jgi:phosphatidylglycerol:prolipoprotein diacylglycerol transferase